MRLAAVAVLLGSLLSAGVQFRSGIDSVTLDVLVTDGGRPVTGLTAADFEVTDNGIAQPARLLGRGSLPLDVILALDMSGSLTAERMAALRAASDGLLQRLQPDDRAGLVTFSHVVRQLQPLTTDRRLVGEALGRADPGGYTALIDAMYAGLAMADPGGQRSLMIVLSDGVDTGSWLTPEAVRESAKRSEVVIYAVSTGGRSQRVLGDVTSATGGKVLDADSRRLGETFVRILDEFRQRYLLSYTLPAAPAPGWHRVEVRVKRRGAKVTTRPGYTVAPARLP